MRLAVLTPTRDRPECLRLLSKWLERQTDAEFTHVVVDDGATPAVIRPDHYLRREPRKTDPKHTLGTNIAYALPTLTDFDAISFAEDDEYLTPDYVARVKQLLTKGDLVGEQYAKIYHVPGKRWAYFKEHTHCSLCRTALTLDVVDTLRKVIPGNESIDIRLWSTYEGRRYQYQGELDSSYLTVSPKGMPGFAGTGAYHRPKAKRWTKDNGYIMLRRWLGEDASVYEALGSPKL